MLCYAIIDVWFTDFFLPAMGRYFITMQGWFFIFPHKRFFITQKKKRNIMKKLSNFFPKSYDVHVQYPLLNIHVNKCIHQLPKEIIKPAANKNEHIFTDGIPKRCTKVIFHYAIRIEM
jgi:hypothetical protein